MKLTKEFIIKDILDYEINEDINIIEELQSFNLFVVFDLLMIGNKCNYEEAEYIFKNAINEMSLDELINQLAYELIGKKPEEDEECNDSNKFSSFSEILENYYNEIQTVDKNLSLNDLWNISTRYMYVYADGLKSRYVHNKNMELQSQYSNVAMFMSALSGKLKECPQLNEDCSLKKDSIADKLRAIKERR